MLGWYSFELRTIQFLRSSKGPSGMVRCIGSLLFLREGNGGDRIGRWALDRLGLFWKTPDRPWKVTSPVKGKSIWNSYSPGLVTYKGADPYPRQVVGRGPWRYGRTIVYTTV